MGIVHLPSLVLGPAGPLEPGFTVSGLLLYQNVTSPSWVCWSAQIRSASLSWALNPQPLLKNLKFSSNLVL